MVLFFKGLIFLANLGLLGLLTKVMIDYRNRHYDNKSWASIFHITSLIWLLMRCLFWICTIIPSMHWNNFSFYLLYWIPTLFEFSSFMVLCLYFAHVLYPKQWGLYYEKIRPWYFGSIVALIAFEIIWSYWIEVAEASSANCESNTHIDDCFHTENSSDAFRLITFVCFSLLSVIQYGFGVKILQIDDQTYKRVLSLSRETMGNVNNVLVACFATRAIYQLFAMNAIFILPDIALESSQGDIPLIVFLATIFWIYLPTMLIIHTITSRSFGNPAIHSDRPAHVLSYYDTIPSYGAIHHSDGLIQDEEDDQHEMGIQLSAINPDQDDEAEFIRESVDRFNPSHIIEIPQREKSFRKQSNLIPITIPQSKESALYGNTWLGSSKTPSFHSISTNSSNSFSTNHQFGSAGLAGSIVPSATSFGNNNGSNHNSFTNPEVTLLASFLKQQQSSSQSSRQELLPPLPPNSVSGSCPEPGSSFSGKGGGIAAGSSYNSQASTPSAGPSSFLSNKGLSPNRPFRFYDQSTIAGSGSVVAHGANSPRSETRDDILSSCSPPSQLNSPIMVDNRKRIDLPDVSIPPFPMTDEQNSDSRSKIVHAAACNTVFTHPVLSTTALQIQTNVDTDGFPFGEQDEDQTIVNEVDDYELQVEPRTPTPMPLNISPSMSSNSSSSSGSANSKTDNSRKKTSFHDSENNISIDLNTSLSTIMSSGRNISSNHPDSLLVINQCAQQGGQSGYQGSLDSSQGISNISIVLSPPLMGIHAHQMYDTDVDDHHLPDAQSYSLDINYPHMEEGRFYVGSFCPGPSNSAAPSQPIEEPPIHQVEIHTTSIDGTHVVVRNTYSPQVAPTPVYSSPSIPGIVVTHTVVPKPTRTIRNRGMGYELPARNHSSGSSDSGGSEHTPRNPSHSSCNAGANPQQQSGGQHFHHHFHISSPSQYSQSSYSWSPSPVFALYNPSPFHSQQCVTPNGSSLGRPPLLSSSFTSSPMISMLSSSPHSSNTNNTLYHNHITRSSSVGGGLAKSVTPERREAAAETRRLRESISQMRPTPTQFSPEDAIMLNMGLNQTSPR